MEIAKFFPYENVISYFRMRGIVLLKKHYPFIENAENDAKLTILMCGRFYFWVVIFRESFHGEFVLRERILN